MCFWALLKTTLSPSCVRILLRSVRTQGMKCALYCPADSAGVYSITARKAPVAASRVRRSTQSSNPSLAFSSRALMSWVSSSLAKKYSRMCTIVTMIDAGAPLSLRKSLMTSFSTVRKSSSFMRSNVLAQISPSDTLSVWNFAWRQAAWNICSTVLSTLLAKRRSCVSGCSDGMVLLLSSGKESVLSSELMFFSAVSLRALRKMVRKFLRAAFLTAHSNALRICVMMYDKFS